MMLRIRIAWLLQILIDDLFDGADENHNCGFACAFGGGCGLFMLIADADAIRVECRILLPSSHPY